MIESWDEEQWGRLDEQSMREKLREEGYSTIVRYVYTPGTSFDIHTHRSEKKTVVLDGELRIEVEGESFVLGPGDALIIREGAPHSATVVGTSDVISLDASME